MKKVASILIVSILMIFCVGGGLAVQANTSIPVVDQEKNGSITLL